MKYIKTKDFSQTPSPPALTSLLRHVQPAAVAQELCLPLLAPRKLAEESKSFTFKQGTGVDWAPSCTVPGPGVGAAKWVTNLLGAHCSL